MAKDEKIAGLKLSSKHMRIEIFTIKVLVVFVLLVAISVLSLVRYIQSTHVDLANTAMYSTKFTTTASKTTGTIEGIYASKDKTRALVVAKMSSVDSISTDASKYSLSMTAVKPDMTQQKMESSPAAMIYFFGSSGYMGIYLVEQRAFPSQILYMRVIGDSVLNTESNSSSGEETDIKDMPDKDQFEIFFNPGASGTQHLNILDSKDAPSAQEVYREAVLIGDQADARKTLNSDIVKLKDDLARIDEMTHRVRGDEASGSAGVGVTLDDSMIPYAIKGDKVVDYTEPLTPEQQQIEPQLEDNLTGTNTNVDNTVGDAANDAAMAQSIVGDAASADNTDGATRSEVIPGVINFDDNGVAEDAKYRFVPATVFPGGLNYDWQAGDLSAGQGYLSPLIQDASKNGLTSSTHAAYFSYLNKQLSQSSSYQGAQLATGFPSTISKTDLRWTYHDGTDVYDQGTTSSDSSDARYKAADKAISDLVDAWNTYLRDKRQYQTTDLKALLEIEDEASVVASATSVNNNASVLKLY